MNNSDPKSSYSNKRPIQTFTKRLGRVSKARCRALEQLLPQYGIPFSTSLIDFKTVFSNPGPVIMDIGFGDGDATAEMAAAAPEKNFLAVEIYSAGVGGLLIKLDSRKLRNVRIIQHDALDVLHHMIPDASLAGFHIFFPDPWPKKRHHKRRLITPENTKLFCQKLARGGIIHTATDWKEYAREMLAIFAAEPRLQNLHTGFAPRPESRPVTRFERRALREGREPEDLVFRRVLPAIFTL